MERIEIKGVEDRLTVARILVANGYTVRIVTATKPNKGTKTTYVEYGKEN